MEQKANLLRQDEAMVCLRSVDDLVINQLMNIALYTVTKWHVTGEKSPVTDFDLCFFMEVVKEVFSDKGTLLRILNGEDLRLWSEEDIS